MLEFPAFCTCLFPANKPAEVVLWRQSMRSIFYRVHIGLEQIDQLVLPVMDLISAMFGKWIRRGYA
jgi:hypothetical protein